MDQEKNAQEQVLDRAIGGDEQAFGLLYQENVEKIYNYIYYRTGNKNDAEDLTSRVFQRALNHITKYKKTNVPFSAWLYRIAHNLVANWYRDSKKKKEVPIEDHAYLHVKSDIPEKEIEQKQEIEFLLKVLHELPHDRQMLLILKYVEDLTNKEIGQIMGKSEGAIKSLYHRTLIELREIIKKGNT